MAKKDDKFTIKAEVREGRGKNDTRRVRAAGKVPLTIYGGEGEPIAASASLAELAAVLRSHGGANTIFSIAVEGMGETDVMFHDRQVHALKGRLMHADLKRIVRGQKLEITVAVHLEGDSYGVKTEGGTLDQVIHEVQVRCLPRNIPDSVQVDVSHLKVNDVMHVKDIKVEEGIEILTDPEAVVATIKFISDAEFEEALTPQVEIAEPEVAGAAEKPHADENARAGEESDEGAANK